MQLHQAPHSSKPQSLFSLAATPSKSEKYYSRGILAIIPRKGGGNSSFPGVMSCQPLHSRGIFSRATANPSSSQHQMPEEKRPQAGIGQTRPHSEERLEEVRLPKV